MAKIINPVVIVKSGGGADQKFLSLVDGTITNVTEADLTGVTSLRNYAFASTSLESIVLPSSIAQIPSGAFYNCRSLLSITLPSGITNIGGNAFVQCPNIQSVTIDATTPPVLDNVSAFKPSNESDPTKYYPIYVPTESVATYQAATNWLALLDLDGNSRIKSKPAA